MGKNKVKKNPGKKGKGKQEVSEGAEVKEKNPFKDAEENTAFKLSEMGITGAEVTVLVGKGAEVLSNNNNNNNVSKEDHTVNGEDCGKENSKESLNWQGSKGLDEKKEGRTVDEKNEELKLEDSSEEVNKLDSSEVNKLDFSEVNKLKDISDFCDSSGFQELSSSLLEKQESQLTISENGSAGVNSSLLENSNNTSFGPNDSLNQGFIDCSFEERIEAQGGKQRKSKKTKAPPNQHQRSNPSYPTIEDFVKAGVPRRIAIMKHPLQNTWTFWWV